MSLTLSGDGSITGLTSSGVAGSSVGYLPAGTGAVATTVQTKLRESVSVKDFGAVGDGVTDDTVALTLARNFLATNATRYKLIFPSGIYRYSLSPNWAIDNAEIEAQGEVRLRYTGTGNAVIVDAGSGLVYNMIIGRFIVEAPTTALNGVYISAVNHSKFSFNVRGAGSSSAGMLLRFGVCNLFENFVCSVNESGWYSVTKPAFGINTLIRNAGETVSYCTFLNPIVEGPDLGIQLIGALGNIFNGGTFEGCTTGGVFASSGATGNKFFGTDFEANGVYDVYCQGNGLELHGCDSTKSISFGSTSKYCIVDGGQHSSILLDAGSQFCSAINLVFNKTGWTGTFTDAGTQSTVSNVNNGIAGTKYLTGSNTAAIGLVAAGSAGAITVTVTGAKLGDQAIGSYTTDVSGLSISAIVTAANTVKVYFVNNITGGPITPANGTCRVVVIRA